jgi:hypothetical protein
MKIDFEIAFPIYEIENVIKNEIRIAVEEFKERIANDNGVFEAKNCLIAQLQNF